MRCYDVDVEPIQRLVGLLSDVNEDALERAVESKAISDVSNDQLRAIVRAYIAAFSCFLDVLRRLLDRRYQLVAERTPRLTYLRGYNAAFDRAHKRAIRLLLEVLDDSLASHPELLPDLVTLMIATETPFELDHSVRNWPIAQSPEESTEQLDVAKEVTDSIKRYLKTAVVWLQPFGRKKKKEERADAALHAINEVLSIARVAA